MDLFGKKEVKALQEAVQTLSQEIEKKGYFQETRNVDNEYFKQVLQFANANLKLIDFSEVDRASLVKYYKLLIVP